MVIYVADGSVIIDTELDESGLKTGLSKMAGTISTGITAAIAAASTAIVALGTAVVKTGMEYESQMSRVQAISGGTANIDSIAHTAAIQRTVSFLKNAMIRLISGILLKSLL